MILIEEGVNNVNKVFTAALQSNDADAISLVYAIDAKLMVPGGEIVYGRDDIREFYKGLLGSGFEDHIYEQIDIGSCNGIGFEAAEFTMFTRNLDGEVEKSRGKHLLILKNIDGQWLVYIDIWNESPIS